jgi:hypothetical protein
VTWVFLLRASAGGLAPPHLKKASPPAMEVASRVPSSYGPLLLSRRSDHELHHPATPEQSHVVQAVRCSAFHHWEGRQLGPDRYTLLHLKERKHFHEAIFCDRFLRFDLKTCTTSLTRMSVQQSTLLSLLSTSLRSLLKSALHLFCPGFVAIQCGKYSQLECIVRLVCKQVKDVDDFVLLRSNLGVFPFVGYASFCTRAVMPSPGFF